MSRHRELIVANGTINNKQDSKSFHEALGNSPLFRHLTKPALVVSEGEKYHVTLHVRKGGEEVLRRELSSKGTLHHWKGRFKIETPT
ncbi:MAG: hypothetical protein M0P64_04435 [Candidatus Pacebacteria bacterium]|nr:hypothetical protein [Candidatus Paceibacterota bacterium]